MDLLAEELCIATQVKPMDHVRVPVVAEGAMLEDDVFLVPFDDNGYFSDTVRSRLDLRVGRCLRIRGGPYDGDVGTIMEKSREGHYRIRVEDSVNPILKMKRRPFSLWLGNWWLEEITKGHGNCPSSGM